MFGAMWYMLGIMMNDAIGRGGEIQLQCYNELMDVPSGIKYYRYFMERNQEN